MTLYYAHQYVTTQLSVAGGISDTDTLNITLQDVTGIDTTKPGIALLDYQDPLDLTKAEWITYTTINVSKVFQGVGRGVEGSIARTHSDGCAIAFPISESHINNLNDLLNGTSSGATLTSPVINTGVFTGGGALSSKIINPTRDMTAVSGDVAYTSVGFTPTAIICFSAITGFSGSWGVVDSAKSGNSTTVYTADLILQGGTFVYLSTSGGSNQTAIVKTFDVDGFTLTWTKTGDPIGTANLIFLCFR